MKSQDFTTTFVVDKTPEETLKAINDVRGWWNGDLKGSSHKLHDEFEVHFGDVHYSKQKLTELVPGKRVVWLVTDSKLNFLKNKGEWTGTTISFDLTTEGDTTQVRFTHKGLVPEIECYQACAGAWTDYMKNSLKDYITSGKGQPHHNAE